MPVYLFKRPRPDMHAGELEKAVKEQLGLMPIHGSVYCEEALQVLNFDQTGKKTSVGSSLVRVDSQLDDLRPVDDFSFGNGVTVDAVRTKENRWVYALWFVFDMSSTALVDSKYEDLIQLINSHHYKFSEDSANQPPPHNIRQGKRWMQIKNRKKEEENVPRTDVFMGEIDSRKHAHLIFKDEKIVVGKSPNNIQPENLMSQFKMMSISGQGVIEYEYKDKTKNLARKIEKQAWPASTTSNTPVDLGFMAITVTPSSQSSRFISGVSNLPVQVTNNN